MKIKISVYPKGTRTETDRKGQKNWVPNCKGKNIETTLQDLIDKYLVPSVLASNYGFKGCNGSFSAALDEKLLAEQGNLIHSVKNEDKLYYALTDHDDWSKADYNLFISKLEEKNLNYASWTTPSQMEESNMVRCKTLIPLSEGVDSILMYQTNDELYRFIGLDYESMSTDKSEAQRSHIQFFPSAISKEWLDNVYCLRTKTDGVCFTPTLKTINNQEKVLETQITSTDSFDMDKEITYTNNNEFIRKFNNHYNTPRKFSKLILFSGLFKEKGIENRGLNFEALSAKKSGANAWINTGNWFVNYHSSMNQCGIPPCDPFDFVKMYLVNCKNGDNPFTLTKSFINDNKLLETDGQSSPSLMEASDYKEIRTMGKTYGVLTKYNQKELAETDLPAVDWLVDGIIPCGMPTLLVADAGVGKTTLMQHIISCLVRYNSFLGRETHLENGEKILYVVTPNEDNPEQIAKKLEIMGIINQDIDIVSYTGDGDMKNLEASFEAIFRENKYRLIVFDTLTACFPTLESMNNATIVNNVLTVFSNISQKYQCAVINIHHNRKDQSFGAQYSVYGSQRFISGSRFVLSLSIDNEEKDCRILSVIKENILWGENAIFKGNYKYKQTDDFQELELVSFTDNHNNTVEVGKYSQEYRTICEFLVSKTLEEHAAEMKKSKKSIWIYLTEESHVTDGLSDKENLSMREAIRKRFSRAGDSKYLIEELQKLTKTDGSTLMIMKNNPDGQSQVIGQEAVRSKSIYTELKRRFKKLKRRVSAIKTRF